MSREDGQSATRVTSEDGCPRETRRRRASSPTTRTTAREAGCGWTTLSEFTKEQLGLEEQLPVGTAVAAALESLGMPRSGSLAMQIDALNSQLGLEE